MSRCKVTFFWENGKSIVEDVNGTVEILSQIYVNAFNNKDRTFTWTSNKMATVLNLDNITAIQIEPAPSNKEIK